MVNNKNVKKQSEEHTNSDHKETKEKRRHHEKNRELPSNARLGMDEAKSNQKYSEKPVQPTTLPQPGRHGRVQ
jgi:hypothetical protein